MDLHTQQHAIDEEMIEQLEICNEIKEMAHDLYIGYEATEEWGKKYPGW